MRKSILRIVLAVLGIATSLAVATPAVANASTACGYDYYGLIGDYYNRFGGPTGQFGCPTENEHDVAEGRGRVQTFQRGQITWSPNQGSATIVSAYYSGPGTRILLRWETPGMHYDSWFLNVRVNGQDKGLDREYFWGTNIGPDWGVVNPDFNGSGMYRLTVEGCDRVNGHTCKQGWTNPLYIWVPNP